MRRLYVHDNKITRIDRLAATKLEILDMSDNALARLENLERLRSLRELSVDGNDIESVSKPTAKWLRARKSSFQLRVDPRQLRANIPRFLDRIVVS